ncbi:hypothetical protein GCM10009839_40130 [Catenulispora yoronensis]|uniref:Uncharacterized protein n=1 Tax=Catenulispora yoronensis TaxID=450799 RepID=A0ABN2UF63_9ACTN
MVTVPLIGILAAVVFFAVRSGYTTVLVALVVALFGFLLADSSFAPTINHMLASIRH